jgi:hypothetical protein
MAIGDDNDPDTQSAFGCNWARSPARHIGKMLSPGLHRKNSQSDKSGVNVNNSFASFATSSHFNLAYNGGASFLTDQLALYQFNTVPTPARTVMFGIKGKAIPKTGTRLRGHEKRVGCVCVSSGAPSTKDVNFSSVAPELHTGCSTTSCTTQESNTTLSRGDMNSACSNHGRAASDTLVTSTQSTALSGTSLFGSSRGLMSGTDYYASRNEFSDGAISGAGGTATIQVYKSALQRSQERAFGCLKLWFRGACASTIIECRRQRVSYKKMRRAATVVDAPPTPPSSSRGKSSKPGGRPKKDTEKDGRNPAGTSVHTNDTNESWVEVKEWQQDGHDGGSPAAPGASMKLTEKRLKKIEDLAQLELDNLKLPSPYRRNAPLSQMDMASNAFLQQVITSEFVTFVCSQRLKFSTFDISVFFFNSQLRNSQLVDFVISEFVPSKFIPAAFTTIEIGTKTFLLTEYVVPRGVLTSFRNV